MYGYVSFSQLSSAIREQLQSIPRSVDLIVGIPRSGMVPAYQIGLYLNRLVTDVDGFESFRSVGHGLTRRPGVEIGSARQAGHILLVDDSLATGASMRRAIERIQSAGYSGRISTCAAIVTPSQRASVDVSFITLAQPRVFEWNAFHHACVEQACFDMDGVLCVDPSERDNDDGPRYRTFLRTARPLFLPTVRIGHIVSARLEKYRGLTEEWLAAHGVQYGQLHLLDLPDKEERMRQNAHYKHKIRIYRETGAPLFYESDPTQAHEIARGVGKPVLCVGDMRMVLPGATHPRAAIRNGLWRLRHPLGHAKGWLKRRLQPRAATALER